MNGQTTPLLFIIRFPDEHGLTSPLSFLPFVPKGLSGTLSVYRPDARPSWQSADSIKTLQGKSEPRAVTVTRELSSTGFNLSSFTTGLLRLPLPLLTSEVDGLMGHM